jgi:hypothetical protein
MNKKIDHKKMEAYVWDLMSAATKKSCIERPLDKQVREAMHKRQVTHA